MERVCMVTGGTAGIGKATAMGLARMGATVVIVGRNLEKGEEAVAEIRSATGNQAVALMPADFASLDSVRALAAEFQSQFPVLHVLVNNAGAIFAERTETADGFESTFGVNHLAPFLLTNLLLDRLKAGAPARIVNVSSAAHSVGKLDFDDLQSANHYKAMLAYGRSKLANILFTYELARRLAGTGVTVNCLHPGTVRTEIFAGFMGGGLMKLLWPVVQRFSISPAEGAETSLCLATDPSVAGVSGRYFEKKREKRSSRGSYDLASARRLWELSEQMVGI